MNDSAKAFCPSIVFRFSLDFAAARNPFSERVDIEVDTRELDAVATQAAQSCEPHEIFHATCSARRSVIHREVDLAYNKALSAVGTKLANRIIEQYTLIKQVCPIEVKPQELTEQIKAHELALFKAMAQRKFKEAREERVCLEALRQKYNRIIRLFVLVREIYYYQQLLDTLSNFKYFYVSACSLDMCFVLRT